jgi:hypothetical protein
MLSRVRVEKAPGNALEPPRIESMRVSEMVNRGWLEIHGDLRYCPRIKSNRRCRVIELEIYKIRRGCDKKIKWMRKSLEMIIQKHETFYGNLYICPSFLNLKGHAGGY